MNELSNWTSIFALILKELLTELKRNKLMDELCASKIRFLLSFKEYLHSARIFTLSDCNLKRVLLFGAVRHYDHHDHPPPLHGPHHDDDDDQEGVGLITWC